MSHSKSLKHVGFVNRKTSSRGVLLVHDGNVGCASARRIQVSTPDGFMNGICCFLHLEMCTHIRGEGKSFGC